MTPDSWDGPAEDAALKGPTLLLCGGSLGVVLAVVLISASSCMVPLLLLAVGIGAVAAASVAAGLCGRHPSPMALVAGVVGSGLLTAGFVVIAIVRQGLCLV